MPGLGWNITSFAFDPVDPSTVWCGQGEPDGLMGEEAAGGQTTPGSPAMGVLVSRDGGATFEPAGLAGISIAAVQVDARGRVWAGTRDGVYVRAAGAVDPGDRGHAGDEWTQYYAGLSGRDIRSLALDPFNADGAYVVTDGGLCVTQDGGNTWVSADPGLPWEKGVPWYGNLVEVAAHPRVNGLVFLRQGKTGLVWYSPNRGGEWFEVPGLRPGIDITGLVPDMATGLYILTRGSGSAGIMWLKGLPAHPASNGRVPDAGGMTWVKGPVLEGEMAWRGGFSGNSSTYLQLYSGNELALAVVDSSGTHFENRTTLPGFGASFRLQAVSVGLPGALEVAYATASEYPGPGEPGAFFFRTRDRGATWEKMGEVPGGYGSMFFSAGPHHEFRVVVNGTDPDNLLVAASSGQHSGVFYSLDGGLTWTPSSGIPDFSYAGILLASEPGKNDFWLYVAGAGLYRSVNGGRSFSLVTRAVSGTSLFAGMGRLYLGDKVSADGGRTWGRLPVPEQGHYGPFEILAVSSDSRGWLLGGYRSGSGYWWWLRFSTDGGHTWRWITSDIGNPKASYCGFLPGGRILLATGDHAGNTPLWMGEVRQAQVHQLEGAVTTPY